MGNGIQRRLHGFPEQRIFTKRHRYVKNPSHRPHHSFVFVLRSFKRSFKLRLIQEIIFPDSQMFPDSIHRI